MFRRRRFREVIDRQFSFFEEDDGDLLVDVDRALAKYERADRDGLSQETVALRRLRVAVEHVPGADQHGALP